MGTYSTVVCQKREGDKWVIVLPEGLGWDPEIPHSYGKLNMMHDIDCELGFNVDGRIKMSSRRQDFLSAMEYAEPDEYAPWSKRGLPEDADDEIKEIFEDEWQDTISWVMVDELLAYDFDKEMVDIGYHGKKVTWTEHLQPAFRMWFERIKAIGVERVIYGQH